MVRADDFIGNRAGNCVACAWNRTSKCVSASAQILPDEQTCDEPTCAHHPGTLVLGLREIPSQGGALANVLGSGKAKLRRVPEQNANHLRRIGACANEAARQLFRQVGSGEHVAPRPGVHILVPDVGDLEFHRVEQARLAIRMGNAQPLVGRSPPAPRPGTARTSV